MVSPQTAPNLKDKKKTELFCNKILDVLKNEESAIFKFQESIDFLQSDFLNLDFKDRKTVERKGTTDIITDGLVEKYLKQS